MALTAKEKMKRYRERMKQNAEKTEAVKEKDRVRKKMKKASLNKRQLQIESLKNKKRVQRHRAKKKISSQVSPGNTSGNITPKKKVTPQSLGKAKCRAMLYLPKSPTTKRAVIESIGADLGLYPPKKRTRTNQTKTETKEIVDEVIKFYNSTSYVCPGRKDYVIIRDDTNNKIKVQKHYMLVTLKEAYSAFLEENPDKKISFSKFANLRPANISLQGSIPHNTCLCKIHENFRLLLLSLEKSTLKLPTSFKEFIDLIVCTGNQEDESCMTGQCEDCPRYERLDLEDEDVGNESFTWNQWSFEQMKTVKIIQEGTLNDCIAELKKQLPHFLCHTYTKRVQAKHFCNEKESVMHAKSKIVIQVDFAENYTTKFQDEIQSAYWSYSQVTLFTACAWAEEGPFSMVIVSDYLSHDKYAVNTFVEQILKEVEDHYGRNFENIVFFSDGAASQFKQKFHLNNMTYLPHDIEWNFFATSHGKGPVDGIGGELKRRVRLKVLSNQINVVNAKEFLDAALLTEGKTKVVLCSEEEIQGNIERLKVMSESIIPIPKTQRVHWVKKVSPGAITYKSNAASDSSKVHRFSVLQNYDEDEDEDDPCIPEEDTQAVEAEETVQKNIEVGSWVVVQYCQKKANLEYTGQVIKKRDDTYLVRFVSKLSGDGHRYIWPENDDEDEISEKYIIDILAEPQMDRRGVMLFTV